MKPVRDLTADERRVRAAELMGWTEVCDDIVGFSPRWSGICPRSRERITIFPDPDTDLNDAWSLLQTLGEPDRHGIILAASNGVDNAADFATAITTAVLEAAMEAKA